MIAAEPLAKMSSDCMALWSIEATVSGEIGLSASCTVDFLLVYPLCGGAKWRLYKGGRSF